MAVGDESDVIFGQEEDLVVTGLRDEQPSSSKEASSSKVPDVLPPDDGRQHREVPEVEAGEEIQAAPDVEDSRGLGDHSNFKCEVTSRCLQVAWDFSIWVKETNV